MPLFLSVRAAIRAIVALQTDAARGRPGGSAAEIAALLDLGLRALRPEPARLIAVGGYSGTGKSVLAASLAPVFGALPGAVLLSSDLERKVGLQKDHPVEAARYTTERREAVYRRMFERAETILRAGHAVVLDATFLDADLREALTDLACRVDVTFHGVWLEAPENVLKARIRARRVGPSDADLSVLRQQLQTPVGKLVWQRLDAEPGPDIVHRAACDATEEVARSQNVSGRLSNSLF